MYKSLTTLGHDFSMQVAKVSGFSEMEHSSLVVPSAFLQTTFLRKVPSPHVTEHYIIRNLIKSDNSQ